MFLPDVTSTPIPSEDGEDEAGEPAESTGAAETPVTTAVSEAVKDSEPAAELLEPTKPEAATDVADQTVNGPEVPAESKVESTAAPTSTVTNAEQTDGLPVNITIYPLYPEDILDTPDKDHPYVKLCKQSIRGTYHGTYFDRSSEEWDEWYKLDGEQSEEECERLWQIADAQVRTEIFQ